MKFVNAHIHLSDKEYNGKVEIIIEDAQKPNVVALVSNSMNYESSMLSLQLAQQNVNETLSAEIVEFADMVNEKSDKSQKRYVDKWI